jgi:hypothetical protein
MSRICGHFQSANEAQRSRKIFSATQGIGAAASRLTSARLALVAVVAVAGLKDVFETHLLGVEFVKREAEMFVSVIGGFG